jgi:hypothetical protein
MSFLSGFLEIFATNSGLETRAQNRRQALIWKPANPANPQKSNNRFTCKENFADESGFSLPSE